ncbi:hypothetical protein Trydic_g13279, partial [Trypoxylus dichotomus]
VVSVTFRDNAVRDTSSIGNFPPFDPGTAEKLRRRGGGDRWSGQLSRLVSKMAAGRTASITAHTSISRRKHVTINLNDGHRTLPSSSPALVPPFTVFVRRPRRRRKRENKKIGHPNNGERRPRFREENVRIYDRARTIKTFSNQNEMTTVAVQWENNKMRKCSRERPFELMIYLVEPVQDGGRSSVGNARSVPESPEEKCGNAVTVAFVYASVEHLNP